MNLLTRLYSLLFCSMCAGFSFRLRRTKRGETVQRVYCRVEPRNMKIDPHGVSGIIFVLMAWGFVLWLLK